MNLWNEILAILFAVLYLYSVFTAVTVLLLENRNPIRSIAWVIVLLFLPFVGLFFYFIFGQNRRQRKRINKLSIRNKRTINKDIFNEEKIVANHFSDNVKALMKLLRNNNKSLVYENNKIEIYAEPQTTFDAMFSDMERATDHIHIEFFIIANDVVGNRFRELLARKACEGVSVKLIYDYWGSFQLDKKYFYSLAEAGVEFHAFYSPKFPLFLSRINYRNHRKIIIVDGKIAYTGGVNMADRYLTGDRLGKWRDTMVRFEGVAVYGLQEAFLGDWFFVTRELISDSRYFPSAAIFDKNCVQVVDSGPDTQFQSIMQGIYFMLNSACRYAYIHTPYFMPPDPMLFAIQTAASLAKASNASYIATLLEAGVRVYIYNKGFLHSKAIVVDDEIATVGTSNMDFRSYEQNFELNTFIYDRSTALQLKELFLKDLNNSREIIEEEWTKRPRRQRLKESLSRLFSPVM